MCKILEYFVIKEILISNGDEVAIGSVIVSITSVVPLILVKRMIPFNFVPQVLPAILSSIVMFIVLKASTPYLAQGTLGMIETTIVGGIVYGATLYTINGKVLKANITKFVNLAFRKA